MIDLNEIKTKLEELGYSVASHDNFLHFYASQIEFTFLENITNFTADPISGKVFSIIEVKESNIVLSYFPKSMLTCKKEFDNVDELVEFIKIEIPLE